MGNKFQVEIKESVEKLKHRLHHAITSSTKERIQMLYWLKTKTVGTRKKLSQRLGRDESTIYRWLRKYAQGGISALLEVKTPPGKESIISAQVMKQLEERLKMPQGFKSYSQIQDWLTQEWKVQLAYKTVHKIVRYKLKATLKVPRPRSAKAKPEIMDSFKKNCQI